MNVKGLSLKIVGSVKNPMEMNILIEEYLGNFDKFLKSKPENEFPGFNKIENVSAPKFNDATLDQKA